MGLKWLIALIKQWQCEHGKMPIMGHYFTSWQYCNTSSLVPTQVLVPVGSGSQRPVCMLMCMLSLPQNMATCGSATANPVPAFAASACGAEMRNEQEDEVNNSAHYRSVKVERVQTCHKKLMGVWTPCLSSSIMTDLTQRWKESHFAIYFFMFMTRGTLNDSSIKRVSATRAFKEMVWWIRSYFPLKQ